MMRMGVGLVILYYLVSWVSYTVVFAGTFALLDRFAPVSLRRHRMQLEFWVAALGAVASVSLPLGFIFIQSGYVDILFGLLVSIISSVMAYRRLRERTIDAEHARGDWLGYFVALAAWGSAFWWTNQ